MISPHRFRPRGRLLDFMRQAGNPRLINLAAGLPSTEAVPAEPIRFAFARALAESFEEATGYQVPDGDYQLRALIAQRLGKRGITARAEDLVVTTGCTQALHGMIRLLTDPGSVVACEAPAYYATLEILGDLDLQVLPLPVRDQNGIDLDLLETLFERYRPKLFVVCSTLSNPSGATMPNAARKSLVEICRRTGTKILEDEIYGELSEDPALRPIRAFDDGSTVAYVSSFSKTVAPGVRVGFCLPGGSTDAFALLKCQQDMHSATVCEVAFRHYLELNLFDQHLDYLRRFNRARRELAASAIASAFPSDIKVWIPSGGFMLWVDLGENRPIDPVYQASLEQNVAFCRGSAFFTSPDRELNAMRLNCSRPSEEDLITGLDILGRILRAVS